MPSLNPELYTVAWIAPLEIEARAALHTFDEIHDGDFPVARGHDYVFTAGKVCGHNVVLATLPPGQPYGTGSAGALAGQVKMFFPNLWFGLLVGVAAGLPNLSSSPPRDIRLGDVLVALPEGDSAGLIAYDLGKQVGENTVELLHGGHVLAKTETVVRSAIGKMKLKAPKDIEVLLPHYHRIQTEEHDTFVDPGQEQDVLYELNKAVDRPRRPITQRTRVWYGPIGSGEKLMRNATTRNHLRDRYGIIGLEMEAAGIMNTIPVGVIRGVCDYADSHKNKDWQPYAAAMAAAYAKAILGTIQPKKIRECHFMVPFGRNSGFVGRESILQHLLQSIPPSSNKDDCQRTAIEGLGGIGKTQVALEAAYRVRDQDPDCSIFWVPAVDGTSFENAYRDIGKALGVPGLEDDKADIKLLVRNALNQSACSWLLIVDNADDIELMKTLSASFPSSREGSILFTTRNHAIISRLAVSPEKVAHVKAMSRDEAFEMLKGNVTESQWQEDTASTLELLDFLTDLPLAIKQASAYMFQHGMSTKQYLGYCQSSDKTMAKLLSRDFEDLGRYKNSDNAITTTWLISFENILRDNPLATQYLKFICFLAEKDIPISLLPPAEDDLEAEEALGTLKGYAFILERESQDSFDIHRLVRLAMRNWLQIEHEETKEITNMIRHLSREFPLPGYKNEGIWIRYLPHVQAALESESQSKCTDQKALHDLLFNMGRGNYRLGKYADAEKFYRQALELGEKVLGRGNPDIFSNMNDLATVLHSQGKYPEAEQMHRQTLELKMKVFDREHPDILASMNNLANVLDSQGKYSEAEKMHQQTLELREKVLGREHPDTLLSMNNVAAVLVSQGKYPAAEQMHRQTLELKEKVLGREHPETLNSRSNLALVLGNLGKNSEAERMHRQILELKERVLGREHPDTVASINDLASALFMQEKNPEAERMYRRALELQEKVLGREHPYTLNVITNLANVLSVQTKHLEAEQLHRYTLQLREEVLGREHPSTLDTIMSLAVVFDSQGKYEEAERKQRQALEGYTKILGKEHPRTLSSMNNLAHVLEHQGRYSEADQMYRQALQLYKNELDSEHPEAIKSRNNLQHEAAKGIPTRKGLMGRVTKLIGLR